MENSDFARLQFLCCVVRVLLRKWNEKIFILACTESFRCTVSLPAPHTHVFSVDFLKILHMCVCVLMLEGGGVGG